MKDNTDRPDAQTISKFVDMCQGRDWRSVTAAEIAEEMDKSQEEAEALLIWFRQYAEELERFLG